MQAGRQYRASGVQPSIQTAPFSGAFLASDFGPAGVGPAGELSLDHSLYSHSHFAPMPASMLAAPRASLDGIGANGTFAPFAPGGGRADEAAIAFVDVAGGSGGSIDLDSSLASSVHLVTTTPAMRRVRVGGFDRL